MRTVRQISRAEANKLIFISKTKLKNRLVDLFFEDNVSVGYDNPNPIAIIMAGLPGSGKTEFLNELFKSTVASDNILRVDLDEIVKMFEDYQPSNDMLFRGQGSLVIEGVFDRAIEKHYNIALDGTFGSSKSVVNIERLHNKAYDISVFVMAEEVEQAWQYTVKRQEKIGRGIERGEFESSINKIRINLLSLHQLLDKLQNLKVQLVRKNMQTGSYSLHDLTQNDIDKMFNVE